MNTTLKAKIILEGNLPNPLWYEAESFSEQITLYSIVKVPLMSRTKLGLVVALEKQELPFIAKPIQEIVNHGAFVHKNWVDFLYWVSEYYHTPVSRVFSLGLPKTAIKLIETEPHPVDESEKKLSLKTEEISGPPLTTDQSRILQEVSTSLDNNNSTFKSFLLHGITGGGKTLIYIHLARACLNLGKNVVILIPEIALTSQIVERFESSLNQKVHVYHSNLGTKDKREFWRDLIAGTAQIIIGVRSLILFPMDNVGLFIVDEEHDGSYKQSDASPRYNARDLALYRGKQLKCPVVLGSATPSLESYYNALNKKHQLLKLETRATNSPLPTIEIVDMKKQVQLQGNGLISSPLRDALTKVLQAGEQVILLMNRRGFAKKRICKNCGEMKICPRCETALIPHKHNNRLLCHCCQYSEGFAAPCSACQNQVFEDVGLAIERVEEYLKVIYPDVKCLRLDRDSTSKVGMAKKIMDQFKQREAQILLGTQMVAKGHDFPHVNLVGIIDGDTGLGIPDFRAHERIFQLITQVSGRAGRHSQRGKVYLQTFQPENKALKLALNHLYEPFYNQEIELRKELFYPPFSRIFKIEFTGKNETLVSHNIREYAKILTRHIGGLNIQLMGPAKSLFSKRKDHYRWQIIGKGNHWNEMQRMINQSLTEYQRKKRPALNVIVDMDPIILI